MSGGPESPARSRPLVQHSAALRRVQLSLDGGSVLLSMSMAAAVQGQLVGRVALLKAPAQFSEYALLAYLVLPLWLGLVAVLSLHQTFERPLAPAELTAKLLKLHAAGLVALALLHFVTGAVVNRSLVLLFLCTSFLVMYAQRALAYAWVRYQHRHGHDRPTLLLVGQPSRRMHEFVRDAQASALDARVLGFVAGRELADGGSLPPPAAPPLTRVGELADLEAILTRQSVDTVVFFPPYQRPDLVQRELSLCESLGVSANFVVELRQLARAAPRITELYNHCVITFDMAPKRPEALAVKHGLDPLVAAVLIALSLPVMALAALAILVTMGRPILYRQERAGRYGRPFQMFKFRTMERDAEARRAELAPHNEMAGPVFKLRDDPRVTRLGRLLRRTSIDELPQLFNVLRGTMSLVGPRPLPVQEQDQIRGWQRRRLSVKPGITCLWQIGGRSDLDFDEWMLLDLKYVDDWSLWLDLYILLRTVPAVLFGRGAR